MKELSPVFKRMLMPSFELVYKSYQEFSGKRIKAEKERDRGFERFIGTLGMIVEFRDPAALVLYKNTLTMIASKFPIADSISASLRCLIREAGGDIEKIKKLGRLTYSHAVLATDVRYNFLEIKFDSLKKGDEYFSIAISRLTATLLS